MNAMQIRAYSVAIAFAFSAPAVAMASSYTERVADLVEFLKEGQIGSGRDVWLAKTHLGELDPVALFFGYYDDLGACRDAARGLNEAFPAAGYICTYAVPE